MGKIIRNLVIILYAAIAIGVTICLLSYNEYKVSEFGSYSLVIIDNNQLAPDFNKGDLVILDKSEKPEIGDKIFFYNTYVRGEVRISCAEVTDALEVTETETTYSLGDNRPISSEYYIGSVDNSTKFGKLGTVLSVIESRWGFLILIVFPAAIAFLYELVEIIMTARKGSEETKKGSRRVKSSKE